MSVICLGKGADVCVWVRDFSSFQLGVLYGAQSMKWTGDKQDQIFFGC